MRRKAAFFITQIYCSKNGVKTWFSPGASGGENSDFTKSIERYNPDGSKVVGGMDGTNGNGTSETLTEEKAMAKWKYGKSSKTQITFEWETVNLKLKLVK